MQDVIAVFSEDTEFSENLCRKLHDRGRIPGELIAFPTMEELIGYFNEHPDSVLLIDRHAADGEVLKLKPERLIYLTDVKGYPVIDGVRTVFKYQAVSGIETELLEGIRNEWAADSGTGLFRAKYIGVASPVGRSRKTSFCLTLGQLLSQKERVLYMNLEPCPGFTALFEKTFPKDLSDLFYAYESGNTKVDASEYMEQFHGLDLVPPVCSPEDIYRTDPMLIKRVVTDLQKSGSYDTVILDLSADYRAAEALIPICRKLYLPTREDVISEAKVREYREWISRISDNADIRRVEEVRLPDEQSFASGKQYLEQLLWSSMGEYVRTILRSAG